MSKTRIALTIVAQALRRPRLLWLLPLAGWHFRRRDWYRRWPFLPLPSTRYLDWRMHTAMELLRSSELGVAAVARRVGYDSEEAFSRAFKRETGRAPSTWRLAR